MPKESLPTQCQLCDHPPFSRPYHFQAHLDSQHSGVKRFQCDECHTLFTRASDLRAHRQERHLDRKKFPCKAAQSDGSVQGCHRVFNQKRSLLRHFRSEEGRSCRPPASAVCPQRRTGQRLEEDDIIQQASQTEAGNPESFEVVIYSTLPTRSNGRYCFARNWTGVTDQESGNRSCSSDFPDTRMPTDPARNMGIFSYRFLNHDRTIDFYSLAGNILTVAQGVDDMYGLGSLSLNLPGPFLLWADTYHALLQLARKLCGRTQSNVEDSDFDMRDIRWLRAHAFLDFCVHKLRIFASQLGDHGEVRAHTAAEERLEKHSPSGVFLLCFLEPEQDLQRLFAAKLRLHGVDTSVIVIPRIVRGFFLNCRKVPSYFISTAVAKRAFS